MSTNIEVTIEIDGKRMTLHGPTDFVREEVRRISELLTRSVQERRPDASGPAAPAPTEDEKDLIAAKKPKSQTETVAVLAYALSRSGRQEFTEEDMRRAYIRAGVRPPTSIGQALRDARNKSDYIAKGSKRASHRLSPHGERLVLFDLPRK
jgi:hypothetical protein